MLGSIPNNVFYFTMDGRSTLRPYKTHPILQHLPDRALQAQRVDDGFDLHDMNLFMIG